MADNTCHFGINNFFGDNSLADSQSWLYMPADTLQMDAIVRRVFFDRGVRFIFSTRAKVPFILKPDGSKFFGEGYEFVPGKDEVIIDGTAGYVVSFGDMLYRAYDAVLQVREKGLDVGLINKPTLNIVDEETIKKIGSSPFVLVVESQNEKTGVRILILSFIFFPPHIPHYSLELDLVLGCLNAAFTRSSLTSVPSRRVVVVFGNRSRTRDLILHVRYIVSCAGCLY